jgi:aldose 1-epimerase
MPSLLTIKSRTICNDIIEYTLSNGVIHVVLLNYGATLIKLLAPDKNGVTENITLCYDSYNDLVSNPGPYYGCIAGRYANRIAKGTFQIDNVTYNLAINNGVNALHGGIEGFDKKLWASSIIESNNRIGIKFTYTSIDGEEGYPGTLISTVEYILSPSDINKLSIKYSATTDKATPINLTNHTYWNLSGECKRKVYDQHLVLNCSKYLPVDDTQIPTGELAPVINTPFDFLQPGRKLSKEILNSIDGGGRNGLDHCYVIDGDNTSLKHVATLSDDASGRVMTVHATQPGVQIYTGNWLQLDETCAPYTQHNAICLETQHFPDSVNKPHFPSAVLHPNQQYEHITEFVFTNL